MNKFTVFEDSVVVGHQFAKKFLSDLDALCNRDYKRVFFYKKVKCLDMDNVECSIGGHNDCTMDAAIGIADYNNNTVSNMRFLLIELRLDYKSPRNLSYTNMNRKIDHTKTLLSGFTVEPKYYFVFAEKLYQRMASEFNRLSRTNKVYKTWKSISPSNFFDDIKFKEDLPYKPLTDIQQLEKNVKSAFSNNFETGEAAVFQWLQKVDRYKVRSNYKEANVILEVLKQIIANIDSLGDFAIEHRRKTLADDVERKFIY